MDDEQEATVLWLLRQTAAELDRGISPGRGRQKAELLREVNEVLGVVGQDPIKFTRGTSSDIRNLG